MFKDISFLERTMLNSIPSKQTILMDDWIIRLNKGYTYRANCVCPFQYSNTSDIGSKIRYCEKLFINNNLPTVFKVTPDVQKGLDILLEKLEYKKVKTVNVMMCTINTDCLDIPQYIKLQSSPDIKWLQASAALTRVDNEFVDLHFEGIRNIGIASAFVSAIKDNKVVGCGYGTIEKNYVGIYGLHVDIKYRKQGIGSSICNAILSYGQEHGADKGYLIVSSLNSDAVKLYENKGFYKAYEYYFYEKPHEKYSIVDA